MIAEWLEKDLSVTPAIIKWKLRSLGYRGGRRAGCHKRANGARSDGIAALQNRCEP
jgi:hypothetical protein